MIAYIIVSELLYTFWHSDIGSGISVFSVMLCIVVALMWSDARGEKRHERRVKGIHAVQEYLSPATFARRQRSIVELTARYASVKSQYSTKDGQEKHLPMKRGVR